MTTSLYLTNATAKEIPLPSALSGTTTSGVFTVLDLSPITIPAGNTSADLSFSVADGDGYE